MDGSRAGGSHPSPPKAVAGLYLKETPDNLLAVVRVPNEHDGRKGWQHDVEFGMVLAGGEGSLTPPGEGVVVVVEGGGGGGGGKREGEEEHTAGDGSGVFDVGGGGGRKRGAMRAVVTAEEEEGETSKGAGLVAGGLGTFYI